MSLEKRGDSETAAEVLARLTGDPVEEFEYDGEVPDLADLDEVWVEERYRERLEE